MNPDHSFNYVGLMTVQPIQALPFKKAFPPSDLAHSPHCLLPSSLFDNLNAQHNAQQLNSQQKQH